MKILRRVLQLVLLLLAVVSLAVFIYLQSLKPELSGELTLAGLKSEVKVHFDEYGVPHIYASSEEDAYFAFGYIHAQDRLFQMDMLRRTASGTLAEIAGPVMLPSDKMFRGLGINKFAKAHADKFLRGDTASYQRVVKSYIRGINAFVENGPTPLEYTIGGIPKQPFTEEDVYYAVGYMAFGFADGLQVDPVLEKIRVQWGNEYLKDLAVQSPPDTEIIRSHNGLAMQDSLISAIRTSINAMPIPRIQGSNAWVISGHKSASGFPVLENDAHIKFGQPAIWYEAHFEYPGVSLYGHHLPCFPFAVLGNNRFCAWGITMFENDDVDFYREQINPANPAQVKFGDQWEDLRIRKEVIKVKGEADVILEVKESRHGPIINDILTNVTVDQPIAISWQLLSQENRALQVIQRMNKAGSMEAFSTALSGMPSPGLNIMYGDIKGNIAWWAVATLPIRPPHVESKLFLDGAGGKDEYMGYYPFEKNPRSINPPWGYVYSANNQPDSIDGIIYPGYYFPKGRAGRIVSLLESRDKFTMDDMKAFAMDDQSAMHVELASLIADALDGSTEKDVAFVVNALRDWKGDHNVASTTPSLYYNLLSQILFLTMEDEIGAAALEAVGETALIENSLGIMIRNASSPWWDNVGTKDKKETRMEILTQSARNALKILRARLGNEPAGWNWGKIHTLTHRHPFGAIKPLDWFLNVGPFPVAGGSEVINNLDFHFSKSGEFEVRSGPSLRKITDLGRIEHGITVSPTGQSGNVMSRHYDDEARMFANGEFREMMMNREAIEQSSENVLVLKPAVNQ